MFFQCHTISILTFNMSALTFFQCHTISILTFNMSGLAFFQSHIISIPTYCDILPQMTTSRRSRLPLLPPYPRAVPPSPSTRCRPHRCNNHLRWHSARWSIRAWDTVLPQCNSRVTTHRHQGPPQVVVSLRRNRFAMSYF